LVLSLSKDGSGFVDEHQPMGLGLHFGLSFSLPRLARKGSTSGRSHSLA
jgi:hypothetical protein